MVIICQQLILHIAFHQYKRKKYILFLRTSGSVFLSVHDEILSSFITEMSPTRKETHPVLLLLRHIYFSVGLKGALRISMFLLY